MLDPTGAGVGGANDVIFNWNGSLNTDPLTAVSNATITSATPFFGQNWTAYQVKIYGPGSYTISTEDHLGGPGCPDLGKACAGAGAIGSGINEPGTYNVNVGAGEIMAHMKFDWGVTQGIDVINVWRTGNWTTLNSSPIFTGPGGTYSGPSYSRVSTDWDSNSIAGIGMVDGPFINFSANFNVSVAGGEGIPEPPVETKIHASTPGTAGCSLSASPVDAMERADWWLVAGFLAWLGAIRLRHRRQRKT
jgi:hypothetical protein